MSEHVLERSQRVEATAAQAFDFYGDALNLEPMTPPWLHFEVLTPKPITLRPDALLDYKLRLHGVPIRWQTRIEIWEPPLRFVDTQVRGPYRLWEHTHLFEEEEDGTAVIHDRVRYVIPFGPVGEIANRLFVRRDLRRIFDFRAEAVRRLISRADSSKLAE